MRNLSFVILALCIINANCRAPKNIEFYYVKIAPIGISDVPRDLFYISAIKLHSITNIDTTENGGFIHQIVTNEKTMANIISFVNKYDSSKINSRTDFIEYGCLNISLYGKNTSITSYNLHRSDSKRYLNSLTDILVKSEGDMKVIDALKEDVLGPISN